MMQPARDGLTVGPSDLLISLPHPALDLLSIVPLPPSSDPCGLKLPVIKVSLDFILTSLRTKDRLSLVTFEVGPSGRVRNSGNSPLCR